MPLRHRADEQEHCSPVPVATCEEWGDGQREV